MQNGNARIAGYRDGPVDSVVGDKHAVFLRTF
jgi:hypothetical protein